MRRSELKNAYELFESYRWRMNDKEAYLKMLTDDYLSFGVVRRIVRREIRLFAAAEWLLRALLRHIKKRQPKRRWRTIRAIRKRFDPRWPERLRLKKRLRNEKLF